MTVLLFAGEQYYPSGGWHDLVGEFPDIDAAKAHVMDQRAKHAAYTKAAEAGRKSMERLTKLRRFLSYGSDAYRMVDNAEKAMWRAAMEGIPYVESLDWAQIVADGVLVSVGDWTWTDDDTDWDDNPQARQ